MIHELLAQHKVVLASASPRRRELFSLLGLNPQILPADVPEPMSDEAPEIQAMQHARNKASFIRDQGSGDQMIVAADTLVAVGYIVLGKPADEAEAKAYLEMLSGREHSVYTSVCIAYKDTLLCDYERTYVTFAELTNKEIMAYIATGEPMDKAGAYGIQGFGAQFIKRVDGCYFNVMGFPIRKFYDMLIEMLKEDVQ